MRWKSDAYRHETSRGRIREFSGRSRSRLRAAALDLGEFHSPDLLVTLTYPGEWRSVASDGPACRRHMEAFRKRLTRYLSALGIASWSALWFREFQRRGAPHFHLLVWAEGLSMLDLRQAARWLSRAWADVVDHRDPRHRAKHLKAGTRIETYRADHFGYACAYATKPQQKDVPDGFDRPGRWWGLWHAEVPAPVVLSVELPLPVLEGIIERLAATVRDHSPAFAANMPANASRVLRSGWSFSARVFGRDAAHVLLNADLDPPQPPASSGAPLQGA